MQRVVLHIEGMSCSHCLNAVNGALSGVPGVEVRSVQIGRAEVDVPAGITASAVAAAVTEAGYRATAGGAE